jgi:hypothetical protein
MGPEKGKDFANTLGPWIVTADELAPSARDPYTACLLTLFAVLAVVS